MEKELILAVMFILIVVLAFGIGIGVSTNKLPFWFNLCGAMMYIDLTFAVWTIWPWPDWARALVSAVFVSLSVLCFTAFVSKLPDPNNQLNDVPHR